MKRIEFKIPEGLTVPEGTQAGGQWQEMATFRLKKNGQMCLVAIGEHKMPGYENGKEESPMYEAQEKASSRYSGMMNGEGNMAPTTGGY